MFIRHRSYRLMELISYYLMSLYTWIRIINKRYRSSLIGRCHHKKSVDTWKKKNKAVIREYNKAYYLKKKHIILYNKKAREETECVMIFDDVVMKNFVKPKTYNRKIITINPKRKTFR